MEIVIIAENFFPKNNANVFTSVRFAWAMAEHGHNVHVITWESPKQLSDDVIEEFSHPNMKVTYLPVSNAVWGELPTIGAYIKRLFKQPRWPDGFNKNGLKPIIEILKGYKEPPILIARDWCERSNIIAFNLKQFSKLCIGHFADPYDINDVFAQVEKRSLISLSFYRMKYWRFLIDKDVARVFFNMDAISLTARNVFRYYLSKIKTTNLENLFLCNHIGTPPMRKGSFIMERAGAELVFSHVGALLFQRYQRELIKEFSLASQDKNIVFNVFGKIEVREHFNFEGKQYDFLKILSGKLTSPRDATDVMRQSDINIVIDAKTILGYCPFLPSKFAYAVGVGQPILAISEPDSEMAKLHQEYGCFYFADITKEGDLSRVITEIYENRANLLRPSVELIQRFSHQQVAKEYTEKLETLLLKRA